MLQEQAREYRAEAYQLQSVGDLIRALSLYQKAVEIDPLYVEAHNDIGVIYEKQGNLEEAKRSYERALEIDAKFMPAHTNLAFLYEKTGDIQKATYHWKQRYIQGRKGEYWHEVARQHLLKLGTYPEVRKEMMEEEAARLSRELSYQKERRRLEIIEEARLHFNIGNRAFKEGAYQDAIENLRKVLSLNPDDRQLQEEASKVLRQAISLDLKQNAFTSTKDALDYISKDDYLSAAERLKKALSAVFRITQEDFSQKK